MYKCFGSSDQEGQRTDGHDDAQQFADEAEIGREEPEEDEDTDRHDQDTQAVREEVGAVFYMPIMLGLIVLAFRYLIEGVLLDYFTFVIGYLVVSILEEEAHQRAICHEGDDPIGFVVSELQAADPYEDDEDGHTDQLASEAPEVARTLEEGNECFLQSFLSWLLGC